MEGIAFVRHETVAGVFLRSDLVAVYFGSYRALLPIFGAGLGVALVLAVNNLRYKGLWVAFTILVYSFCLGVLVLSPWFLISVAAVFLLGCWA